MDRKSLFLKKNIFSSIIEILLLQNCNAVSLGNNKYWILFAHYLIIVSKLLSGAITI